MPVKDKVQCPIRLYKDQYDKIKAKMVDDKLSFQKLSEILFTAYLKNNKEVMRLVRKYVDEKDEKKRRFNLDSIEREELLRLIEEEHSPLKDVNQAVQEMKDEE